VWNALGAPENFNIGEAQWGGRPASAILAGAEKKEETEPCEVNNGGATGGAGVGGPLVGVM
jgi:hypothetical protein